MTTIVNSIGSVDGKPVRFPTGVTPFASSEYIGVPGEMGFGVGTFPHAARFGLLDLTANDDPLSPTYGNYQAAGNGSVFVFVPKFYYRIGHVDNPTYATHGLNSLHVVGKERFTTRAEAMAAGYAMPRAFIDGGIELDGFFYAKYIGSYTGGTAYSLPNSVPTRSVVLATYVDYAKSIIPGHSTCISLFQASAVALLSLAHGQAATSASACAWYDAAGLTNYPKGCNNNALGDQNDADVTYLTAGDGSYPTRPLTGSGTPFAKTTHNGQANGIADVNGNIWQVALGVTSPGSSSGDSTIIANGTAFVLKESVRLADLTSGWNTGTDAWGDATHLATLYDEVTDFLPWADATNWIYVGNGSNQVFDPALSGDGWLRTAAGLPKNTDAMSASGTNLFGNDGIYRSNRANVFPLCGGPWSNSQSGVFARNWGIFRTSSNLNLGFRASVSAAFGS